MTQKIKHVTLLKVRTCKTCDTQNQTCNTFKIRTCKTCDTENQTCNTLKVEHVKHVTQKIKHVTL